ncbi:MAG: hypothetical protein LBR56_06020 [Sporomusaceae bacterium]|jgi:hypothetical protein|nr:hypothetical protein [Sporomusaceae bacterium]
MYRNYSQSPSWQNLLGNFLGGLIGANYAEKDFDRRVTQYQALGTYKDDTQDKFIESNPDIAAAINNPNMPDEAWDTLGAKHGMDVAKYKDMSNFHRGITQDGIDYNTATTDEERQSISARADARRNDYGEKYKLLGYGKEDNITNETFMQSILPQLKGDIQSAFQKQREAKYLAGGGDMKILQRYNATNGIR